MVGLILDNKIRGRIDQVGQLLELDASKYDISLGLLTLCRGSSFWKYRAVEKWASQLGLVSNTILQRLA